jgi:hypothetical protein
MKIRHFKKLAAAVLLVATLFTCTSCVSPLGLPAWALIEGAEAKLAFASSFTVNSTLSLTIPKKNGKPTTVVEEGRTEYYGLHKNDFSYYSEFKTTVEKSGQTTKSSRMEAFSEGTHLLETMLGNEVVNRLSSTLTKAEFLDYLEEDAAVDFTDGSLGDCSSTVYKFSSDGKAMMVCSGFGSEELARLSSLTRGIEYLFPAGTVLSDVRFTVTANLFGYPETVRMEYLYEGANSDLLPTLTVENVYERINSTERYVYTPTPLKKFTECSDIRVIKQIDNMLCARRFAEKGEFQYGQNVNASDHVNYERASAGGTISFGVNDGGFYYTSSESENDSHYTRTYENGTKTTITKKNGQVVDEKTVKASASSERSIMEGKMVPFLLDGQTIKSIERTDSGWSISFKKAAYSIAGVGRTDGLKSAVMNVTVKNGEITKFEYAQTSVISSSRQTVTVNVSYLVKFVE